MNYPIIKITIKIFKYGLFFLIALFFIVTVILINRDDKMSNKIYPNVYIDNVDFSETTIDTLNQYFNEKNDQIAKKNIVFNYRNEEIATISAKTLNIHYDIEGITQQASSVGRAANFTARIYQKISSLLNLEKYYFSSQIIYDDGPVREYLNKLSEKYDVPAKNALFEVVDNKVSAFRIEENGLQIDTKRAFDNLNDQIRKLKKDSGKNINIRVRSIKLKPDVTLASVNDFGIVEKIGEGRSNYRGSAPERVHNLSLAAARINGTLVPKGEIFSFNNAVGEISTATGYKQAYVIEAGRTVLGDGGGVCQDSTTMFRAALDAGLPIVERSGHAYRVRYYENDKKPGFDATVYAPSVDFKFKNDTPAHILVQTEVVSDTTELVFTLYGKKDGREVEISDSTVWDAQPPPPPVFQDDPTLPKGETKQVDWAAPGAKAKFTYKVTRDSETLIDREFYTNFKPWKAVFLVGTME